MNVVVLQGQLSSDPILKVLESGSVLMNLELTTRVDGVASSVPLVWFDPPEQLSLASGDEVSLVGTVRRRFYRAGGSTQSRTEVVVELLALTKNKRALASQRKWISGAMGSEVFGGLRSA